MFKFLLTHLIPITCIFAAVLAFLKIPEIILGILYILIWGLCMFLKYTVSNRKEKTLALPLIIFFLSQILIAIGTAYTRLILLFEMRIRMNPESGFKFMYLINIIISGALLILANLFIKKNAANTSKIAARFALDSMNQRLFEVDTNFNSGAITEEVASIQKEEIRKDIDFYSTLDGSARFLAGTIKFQTCLYVIAIVGGCLYGVFKNGYSIQDALNIVCLPAMLSTICSTMSITTLASCVSYTLMEDDNPNQKF
ncbi:Flagellar biosynthesis pathway, component FlhA [Treponema sp. JC4]|uniref:FHIPEP family type III secretion protein n=1 Tax=Treponema sp. JC4 TaxID=1124982 RepID=UPI00025B0CD1|nr:FHIPEP family type III secretion protein [Treponema sp. JC4]EID84133.1 Flagellar biosynthesis pathway, component FlhA [Treponema sp. JC4]